MKTNCIFLFFCVACNRGLESGEYTVTYLEPAYGTGSLDVEIDTETDTIRPSYEENLTAADCAPLFQMFTPSTQLEIDQTVPSVTEVNSENDPRLDFTSADWEYSYTNTGLFGATQEVDDDTIVFEDFISDSITIDNEGESVNIDLDFQVEFIIKWNYPLKRTTGQIDIYPDTYILTDEEIDLLRTQFNPDCSFFQWMNLEPI